MLILLTKGVRDETRLKREPDGEKTKKQAARTEKQDNEAKSSSKN